MTLQARVDTGGVGSGGKGEQRLDKKLKRRVESLELPEYHVLYCGRILHQDASPHPDGTPHPDVMIGDSFLSAVNQPSTTIRMPSKVISGPF